MQKRSLLLVAMLVILLLPLLFLKTSTQANAFSGSGSGTAGDPYIITTVDQLQEMKDDLAAHYALGCDIDASATIGWNDNGTGGHYGFLPIGTGATPFTGSFDGRGYKIDNLYINRPDNVPVSLFGINGIVSTVKNVGLENVNITGKEDVGGLIGYNNGTVSDSYSTGSVSGVAAATGGIVGWGETGTVTNCYSTATVNGGSLYGGGFIGYNKDGTLTNCYSTGSVSGGNYVGGFVGQNLGIVSNCYSTGSVSGDSDVGGLDGSNTGTLTNCYSTGSASGTSGAWDIGGLIGGNNGTVTNCYSTGSASGDTEVGGLIGYSNGTVSDSYSTGSVSGTWNVGGLVGANDDIVTNSFWDNQTSGQSTSAGGTGKTTENMKNVRTFTDNTWSENLTAPWDFIYNPYYDENDNDIWNIHSLANNGYPFLTWAWAFILPPTQPSLLSPENAAYVADNTPTFVWENGAHADNHRLLLDNDSDFLSPNENRVVLDNTYTIADENSLINDIYYWKVVAINDNGENESDVWTFDINQLPSTTNLKTEGLVNPTGLTTFTPTFSWGYSDNDNDAQSNYQIQVGVNEDDNSMWDNTGTTLSQITYSGNTLSRGVTYYVRVRVKDNYEWSSWINGTFKLSSSSTVTVGDNTIELKLVEAGDVQSISTSIFTIVLTVKTRSENLIIYYSRTEEQPQIPTASNIAPFYFDISSTNSSAIAGTTITFNIPRSWVVENNIVPSTLYVLRKSNGAWWALPSKLVGEDSLYYYLEATTNEFSLFGVSGQKVATPTESPTGPQTSSQIPQLILIAALGILIISAMLLASNLRHHKQRK